MAAEWQASDVLPGGDVCMHATVYVRECVQVCACVHLCSHVCACVISGLSILLGYKLTHSMLMLFLHASISYFRHVRLMSNRVRNLVTKRTRAVVEYT